MIVQFDKYGVLYHHIETITLLENIIVMRKFEQFDLNSEIVTSAKSIHLIVKGYPSADNDTSVMVINEFIPIESLPWNQHISDNVQVIVEQLKNKIFASLFIEDALLYEEIHEVNL